MTTRPPIAASKFIGAVPKNYDEYMGPMFFEEYAIEIANRIDPSTVQTALELSSGTGRVTRHIFNRLGSGTRLIASDVSADMMTVAKDNLSKTSIEWRSIDFNQIPFDDNSINLIVCSFGYMFAEDKVKAFAEARRVLRPGGQFIISTWDKLQFNGASNVFRQIIRKYFGDSLPETYKIPYSMFDADLIRQQLAKAGFTDAVIDVVQKQSVSPTAKMATVGMVQGGSLFNEIVKRDPTWLKRISDDVERELSEMFGAQPMIAPMRALIIEAHK